MAGSHPVEISCPACGTDALLLRTPRYDGFSKVGETLSCSACGHEFDSEEQVPFRRQAPVRIFTDADRSAKLDVFEGEETRLCLHCRHYVVNPFTQWCGVHKKEVAATDTCSSFDRKDENVSPL